MSSKEKKRLRRLEKERKERERSEVSTPVVPSVKSLDQLPVTAKESVDELDVASVMNGLDLDSLEQANDEFTEEMLGQIDKMEKADQAKKAAEEGLKTVLSSIGKMSAKNKERGFLGDSDQIKVLRDKEKRLREIIKIASDKEKFDARARKLREFRKTLGEVEELVRRGRETLNDIKARREVSEARVREPKDGYARYLYRFVEEDNLMIRVPEEQLEKWGQEHQDFHKVAASWTVKHCPDHHRDYCDHFYQGIHGNEQSITLAKALVTLSGVNSDIRYFLKKRADWSRIKDNGHQIHTPVSNPVPESKQLALAPQPTATKSE